MGGGGVYRGAGYAEPSAASKEKKGNQRWAGRQGRSDSGRGTREAKSK